jgi:Glycosyl hydrolase family 71
MTFAHDQITNNMKKAAILLLSMMLCFGVFGQDTLKNLPEFSLPLTDKKLVIAHNMTNIIRYQGHKIEDSGDPDYYSPTGNVTESIGGLVQVKVMYDKYFKDSTLEQRVEFEMRTAMKCGIDGFQFYYPLRQRGSDDDIIIAYFKVADKLNLDFKLTLCPSHPSELTEDARIAEYARRMNYIFDAVGHDNSHWLRTPDGRLILYLWYGEQIADIPADSKGLPRMFYAARAYKKLSQKVNENFACVVAINHQISETETREYLDYFPAVWMWTLPYTDTYVGKKVAKICREQHRTYTGSTFSDFYTSKVLRTGTWDMFDYAIDAATAGLKKIERKGIVTNLSYNYRKLLEFAIEEDVPIINIITWNDYPEGHHLAPEINHNYGFSVLLKHYKAVWKGEPSPYANKDVAIVFFRKYRHDIIPVPYNVPFVNIERFLDPVLEDSVEVVTILKAPAELMVNGAKVSVKPGIISTKFILAPGRVSVAVVRKREKVIDFITPEGITGKPYRTDRLIYCFSSEFYNFHKAIFGDLPPEFSTEYAQRN